MKSRRNPVAFFVSVAGVWLHVPYPVGWRDNTRYVTEAEWYARTTGCFRESDDFP